MASKPKNVQPTLLKVSDIKEHQFRFQIDKKQVVVTEHTDVLEYCTPHFRALATLEIPPLPDGMKIQVGWIQVVAEMMLTNTYGSFGRTSWEFPELVTRKFEMVSDADGTQYPWYGSKNQVAKVEGPTSKKTVATVSMHDSLRTVLPWHTPASGYSKDPCLTFVYRKQKFFTYLALKDVNTSTYQIIKTLTWTAELAIEVQPLNPVGKRAKLLGLFEQDTPKVLPNNINPLKCYALGPPNANRSQALLWRPKFGNTELIVSPLRTTVDMAKYLIDTKDHTQTLVRINKTNFLNRWI